MQASDTNNYKGAASPFFAGNMIFSDKKFSNPIKIIEAFDNESFKSAFDEIENLRKSYYLLGYIRYEAKDIFLDKNIKSDAPLLYFEVFENYEKFEMAENFYPLNLESAAQISYDEYSSALMKIKDFIAQGDTYQVNYTYDYLLSTDAEGFELYQRLLQNQKTSYNAYIKNKYEEILCFSPELFFEVDGNKITTKPMKGTVKRGVDEGDDKKNIEFLKFDIKNRAENVMIVDLLRNDLGKIAEIGTVKADKLFEIESHKTVHQMTSEVSAELPKNISFYQIFEAIFPCGSVTGAPKIKTMQIIEELEKGSRDIYCGAIGLISPQKSVFNVPIRTLQKKNNENKYHCRVGGGIVWDSDILEEWDETLTKIQFLNSNFDFQLIETIKIENFGFVLGDLHFARMRNSAEKLGFEFNENILKIKPEKNGIMRILLSKNGNFDVQYLPLNEILMKKVVISNQKMKSDKKFLQHKTTYRPWYENSMQKIKVGEIYDEIFLNEKDEITEGARSNIVVSFGGKLYTPPLHCGLLNGVLRQKMIEEGLLEEKVLYISDLKEADEIFAINSVRGIRSVNIDFD